MICVCRIYPFQFSTIRHQLFFKITLHRAFIGIVGSTLILIPITLNDKSNILNNCCKGGHFLWDYVTKRICASACHCTHPTLRGWFIFQEKQHNSLLRSVISWYTTTFKICNCLSMCIPFEFGKQVPRFYDKQFTEWVMKILQKAKRLHHYETIIISIGHSPALIN